MEESVEKLRQSWTFKPKTHSGSKLNWPGSLSRRRQTVFWTASNFCMIQVNLKVFLLVFDTVLQATIFTISYHFTTNFCRSLVTTTTIVTIIFSRGKNSAGRAALDRKSFRPRLFCFCVFCGFVETQSSKSPHPMMTSGLEEVKHPSHLMGLQHRAPLGEHHKSCRWEGRQRGEPHKPCGLGRQSYLTHQEVHFINEVSYLSMPSYSISLGVVELSLKSHFYASCFSSGISFTSPE